MPKLKQATIKDINSAVLPEDAKHIENNAVYVLNKRQPTPEKDVDSLVEVEIALRKCKRVGMFKK